MHSHQIDESALVHVVRVKELPVLSFRCQPQSKGTHRSLELRDVHFSRFICIKGLESLCVCARAFESARAGQPNTTLVGFPCSRSQFAAGVCLQQMRTALTQYLPDGEVQRWSGQTLEIGSNGLATRIEHGLT